MKNYINHLFVGLEQITSSGANFATTIILAYFLNAVEFGFFSVLYTIIMLGSVLHSAFISEPLLIFGGKKNEGVSEGVFNMLFLWCFFGLLMFSIYSFFSICFFENILNVESYFSLLVAWIGYGFFWTAKYLLYLRQLMVSNVIMGVGYGIATILGIVILHYFSGSTVSGSLSLMGGVALVFSFFGFWQYFKDTSIRLDANTSLFRFTIIRKWFQYGKWSAVSGVCNWGLNNGSILILSILGGLEASGIVRLGVAILMPAQQVINSISIFLIPVISRELKDLRSSIKRLRIRVFIAFLISSGMALLTFLVFNFLKSKVGIEKYHQLVEIMPFLVFLMPLWAINSSLRSYLKALERPKVLFFCYLFGLMISCLFPFFAINNVSEIGVYMSSVGLILGNLVVTFAMCKATGIYKIVFCE